MFLFISILLLFINYFTVQRELEEIRNNLMIAKPKGQNGLFNSQGEVDEPGPREYLRTGGERGQTVDERDKRKPNVKTSSPSSSTDPDFTTTSSIPSSTVSEVCFTDWTFFEHTGLCYKHTSNKTIQADALSSCKHSLRGLDVQTVHLVSIPDKITNDFLTTVTREASWTGGYQDDSETWHWSDGSTWTGYDNWASGQPDNCDWRNHAWGGFEDYLGINFEGVGNWNDYPPLYLMGALCQYDPEALTSTNAPPTTTQATGGGCESGWKYLGQTKKCYKFISTATFWTDAGKTCKSATNSTTANLASVHDITTFNFLKTLTKSRAWLGGFRVTVTSAWQWTDGSKWSYSNWEHGEPNNYGGQNEKYVLMNHDFGAWADFPNKQKYGAMCQYKPTTCESGWMPFHQTGKC